MANESQKPRETTRAVVHSRSAHSKSAQKSRILAPDIARGTALLGIALANVSTAWLPSPPGAPAGQLGGIVHESVFEQIYAVLAAMFIHVRGLPMFSTLLGYGVGMVVYSLWRRQYPETAARGVILRRYGFLAIFGIIHLAFLFWGDIMFFYGVAGMLFALIMTAKDKVLWWIAGTLATVYVVFMIGGYVVLPIVSDFSWEGESVDFSFTFATWGEYFGFSLLMVPAQFAAVIVEVFMLGPVMIVGYLAARHRVLSRVDEFRKELWIATGIFIAIAVCVGLPWGLAEIGVLPQESASMFYNLNQAVGALTGPGIVAAIALMVQPVQRKLDRGEITSLPWPLRMLAALGARSMSGYVGQSIIFLLFTQAFTLGIGQNSGILGSAAVAIVVWLVTLLIAYGLDLAGKRGPFETMHRYAAYGKKGLQDPYQPKQLPSSGYTPIPDASPLNQQSTKPRDTHPNR